MYLKTLTNKGQNMVHINQIKADFDKFLRKVPHVLLYVQCLPMSPIVQGLLAKMR